jgi:hypothetical protein
VSLEQNWFKKGREIRHFNKEEEKGREVFLIIGCPV